MTGIDNLKWYGHRGLAGRYILIALLAGTASLQAVYFPAAGRLPQSKSGRRQS